MSEVTRDMLMAYADGQLDADERATVETALTTNPDAAAEVALLQRQTDAIKTLFAPAGAEAVPARLKPRRLAAELSRRRANSWGWAAAAIVLVSLGLGAGWFARPLFDARPASASLIADAVNAHTVYVAENRHAVEVASNDSEHLSTWLSNRLATPLDAPDLNAPRALPWSAVACCPVSHDKGGRAAQLMYENAVKRSGHRLRHRRPARPPTGLSVHSVTRAPRPSTGPMPASPARWSAPCPPKPQMKALAQASVYDRAMLPRRPYR
jgi:anti-sigma factor RsiW